MQHGYWILWSKCVTSFTVSKRYYRFVTANQSFDSFESAYTHARDKANRYDGNDEEEKEKEFHGKRWLAQTIQYMVDKSTGHRP